MDKGGVTHNLRCHITVTTVGKILPLSPHRSYYREGFSPLGAFIAAAVNNSLVEAHFISDLYGSMKVM